MAIPIQATGLNEVWSWDFVHDCTNNGSSLKMLTLIDEDSRESLKIEVARKLRSAEVLNVLAEVMAGRSIPKYLCID